MRDKGNEPEEGENLTEQCVTELATTKGAECSIIKNIVLQFMKYIL